MINIRNVIIAVPMLLAACLAEKNPCEDSVAEVFNIAANTEACQGIGPMRCLVVNDKLFYVRINGYEHVEGQPAKICVVRSRRPKPIGADQNPFLYRRVDLDKK